MPKVEALPRNQAPERCRWMGILAKAQAAEVAALWAELAPPAYGWLRRPETGLVMVRGRMGGDGAPFNLGEMTVTRCSVRLETGLVGHAWVAGRDAGHAERAAVIDALLQQGGQVRLADAVTQLERTQDQRRQVDARKAAATKVDFFTMVRGED